ncbi:MAG: hypothetical protein JSR67_03860 [Proteobacteria bacterium]|nr:hypothetical protein [Pseudomonadota bacterium]
MARLSHQYRNEIERLERVQREFHNIDDVVELRRLRAELEIQKQAQNAITNALCVERDAQRAVAAAARVLSDSALAISQPMDPGTAMVSEPALAALEAALDAAGYGMTDEEFRERAG